MANYRVVLKGAHGRQVYVQHAGSKSEAHVKACAQGICEPDDVECVERTTINPEDLDSGRKDGHGCPRVLMPNIPWHRCSYCGHTGHLINRCPTRARELQGSDER
jgi:hypothetical protein